MMGIGGYNITDPVRPDYSLTLLHITKNLRGLSHLNSQLDGNHSSPSWVPEWTTDFIGIADVETEAPSVHYGLLDPYNACAVMRVDFIANLAASVLSIRGVIVDTIKGTENYTTVPDGPEYHSNVVDL